MVDPITTTEEREEHVETLREAARELQQVASYHEMSIAKFEDEDERNEWVLEKVEDMARDKIEDNDDVEEMALDRLGF